MPVIAPARYQPKEVKKHRRPYIRLFVLLIILVGSINYFRPLPSNELSWQLNLPTTTDATLTWPAGVQAAVAAKGYGLLGTSGSQTPVATASIAKVITALCVLEKLPLNPGEQGPTYTIDASDMAIYNDYAAKDGSLLGVAEGDQLTEYEAIVALMLPSANNIADSLAIKVFGSQDAYASYAARYLQRNNMNGTHIGSDASGFDSSTTSTASDLSTLGLLALENPVLMGIAQQSSIVIPGIGTVYNYDTILGQNGITGLKTGNNDTDKGAFLFTATTEVGNKAIPLSGAVMGATSLSAALADASTLVASLEQQFEQEAVLAQLQVVGTVTTAWGASAPVQVEKAVNLVHWRGTPFAEAHKVDTRIKHGIVGTITVTAGPNHAKSSLSLAKVISGPSFWWRLTRH